MTCRKALTRWIPSPTTLSASLAPVEQAGKSCLQTLHNVYTHSKILQHVGVSHAKLRTFMLSGKSTVINHSTATSPSSFPASLLTLPSTSQRLSPDRSRSSRSFGRHVTTRNHNLLWYRVRAPPKLKKKYSTTKTYNTEDSPVVTDLSTSSAVSSLSKGERTGSRAFYCVWSYVMIGPLSLAYSVVFLRCSPPVYLSFLSGEERAKPCIPRPSLTLPGHLEILSREFQNFLSVSVSSTVGLQRRDS